MPCEHVDADPLSLDESWLWCMDKMSGNHWHIADEFVVSSCATFCCDDTCCINRRYFGLWKSACDCKNPLSFNGHIQTMDTSGMKPCVCLNTDVFSCITIDPRWSGCWLWTALSWNMEQSLIWFECSDDQPQSTGNWSMLWETTGVSPTLVSRSQPLQVSRRMESGHWSLDLQIWNETSMLSTTLLHWTCST